ncbi:hypothetical protein BD309DRAFT_962723 [Dichomitus squalens]|nr:hypothetical protein BD309DRAFT_962723 [Dichomitus squalens]
MIVKTLRLSTLHPRPFLCPQRSPLPPLSVHANRAVAAHAQTLLSASGGVCHLSTLEDRFDYSAMSLAPILRLVLCVCHPCSSVGLLYPYIIVYMSQRFVLALAELVSGFTNPA